MRKEPTLPIAERMENVSFAVSIDPACRKSAALRQKMRLAICPRPFEEDHARPFAGQSSRKVVKEEDGAYEADGECISAT
jgi:hypothetical protein